MTTSGNSTSFGDLGEEHENETIPKHSAIIADGSGIEASGINSVFSFPKASDDDFIHEITMKKKSPKKTSPLISNNLTKVNKRFWTDDKETFVDANMDNNAQGENDNSSGAEDNVFVESGSAFNPNIYSGNSHDYLKEIDNANIYQHSNEMMPTRNSLFKKSTIITEPTQDEFRSIEKTNLKYIHKPLQTFEEQLKLKNMARERAVSFVKYFRDGISTNTGLTSKRTEITRPSEMLLEQQRKAHPSYPTIQEIFKRDRIQIHKNIEQLADKYKHNTLLSDLSKVTGKDWMDYKDGGKDTQNPVWMKFLKDAIEPKHVSQDVNAEKRQKFLGYIYKPNLSRRNEHQNVLKKGNMIYHKVRLNKIL